MGVEHPKREHLGVRGDGGHPYSIVSGGRRYPCNKCPVAVLVIGRGTRAGEIEAWEQLFLEIWVGQFHARIDYGNDHALPARDAPGPLGAYALKTPKAAGKGIVGSGRHRLGNKKDGCRDQARGGGKS